LAVDGTFTASNYTITYHAGTLTVNVKPITVTAVAQSKTADASMPTLTWNVSPSISGLAALTGSLDVTWGIGNSHIVGIYPIVQGTVTNGNNPNYNITYVGDNLTVTPGAATKVVVTISPAGAVAGSAFVTQPTVKIEDFYGNTVNSTATVELGIKSGTGAPGASLAGGATSMSATGGVANFSSLGINWAYSGYVLTATSTGLASGDSSSFDVTAPSGVTSYTFPLNPGWNLISLPLIPTDSSITAVLGGLSVPYATNVLSVWSYNAATTTWTSWAPGVPSPSLTTMVDGKGYWIHMIDALPAGTTITFSGSALPLGGITPPPSYAVVVGWNLMGFESTLANTVTNYLTGNNYRFPIYWYGLNTYYAISTGGSFFQPGLGYWVYFNAAGVVTPS
jgi:hypothetical protein